MQKKELPPSTHSKFHPSKNRKQTPPTNPHNKDRWWNTTGIEEKPTTSTGTINSSYLLQIPESPINHQFETETHEKENTENQLILKSAVRSK
jgi:hypothetical protein